MALTGTSLVLVLLSASESAAQDAPTDVSTIEGVTGFEVQADGSALVSLENGTTVRLAPGSFELAGDSLLVAASIADQIAANAALAAAGGAGGAAIGGLAALAGLAGAGGGGGGDEPLIGGGSGGGGSTTLTPGSVVDGYIVGASVFQDVNGNGIFDTGEPNTVTDANGDFEIELANETAKLISIGGTDSSTGQAFTGTLTAPAGSSVVTPLTTLVQSYAEANGIDASEASDDIAAALGLDGNTNLLDLDPVAAAASGDTDAFAIAAQVASVISAAAAAVGEDGASEASAAVAASLASALVDDEGESPKDNLTSGDAITAALQAAGVEEDQVSSIEAAVTAANGIIASGDSVQAIEAVQEVVQGSLVEAIGQSSEEGPVDIPDATAIEEAVSLVVPLRPVLNDPNEAFGIFGPTELGSASLEISGTGRPDSWVKVSVVDADGQEVTSDAVQVDAQGDWALVLDSAELPSASGEYGIKVGGSLDETGPFTVPVSDEETAGTITIDVTGPDAPTIDDLTADADNRLELDERNSDFEVSGTTEANASVTVTINGEEESSQADGDGEFRVTFDSFSTDTNFTVSVVATDTLGNVGTAGTRDVEVEPESALIPTVNAVSEAFGGPDLANGLVVTGTGRDGSTVSVTIGGITKEATFGEGDTWSVTFEQGDLPDADGSYPVAAVATLGNFSSDPVAGGTLSINVTGPDAPTITGVIADGTLSLDERSPDL
ncbi:MAG: hypothetical protein MK107_15250, partial [Oceanicola sp.]|nr:hypothetical protein [Oceanicola sp.]